MVIKIVNAVLISFAVFMGLKQGRAMVSAKPLSALLIRKEQGN